jgi:very-short-patch-repair endonuclease
VPASPAPRTARLRELADARGGVLALREARAAGVPRWVVRLELRTGRWQRAGRQTVVTHNGPLTDAQRRAVAVLETGPRAALDGVSALQQHGVGVEDDGSVHVVVPKSSNALRPRGARVHESRRFREDDVRVVDGVRTVAPAVAAVHAALWARTDREATLLLVLPVQQRLARPQDLAEAASAVRRARRRRVIAATVLDVADGARSMGELDVARALRRRGLPEPARQVVRRRPSGTQYLDCRFDGYDLALEVDGAGHAEPLQVLADLLRDLTLVSEGDTVVRLPLVTWRLAEERVLDALEAVFTARGWRRPAA